MYIKTQNTMDYNNVIMLLLFSKNLAKFAFKSNIIFSKGLIGHYQIDWKQIDLHIFFSTMR